MTNDQIEIAWLREALDKIYTLSSGNPNHAKAEVMLGIIHDLAERVLEEGDE